MGGPNDCIHDPTNPLVIPCATIVHALSVADSGDTIRIEDGPITECDIQINKSITLLGIGVTPVVIDAGYACQHLYVAPWQPADVTLDNLKLIHGSATNGGAIRVSAQGSVTLLRTQLIDNVATEGGAIYNAGTVAIQTDSVLESNEATTGGAIQNSGSVVVENSNFVWNSATTSGGAINSNGGDVDIAGAVFSLNTASNFGGAISTGNTTVSIDDSTLFGNSVDIGFGGAVSNTEGSTLKVTGSILSWNEANGGGGGIHNDLATATIVESTLSGNLTSLNGGGIANLSSATLTLRDSTLVSNDASGNGGALFDSTGDATGTMIRRNTFSLNTATDGGAIFYNGANNGEMFIINSTFSGNSSDRGAAVFDTGFGSVAMANSTLYGQVTVPFGGAIFNDSAIPFGMNNSIINETTITTGGPGSDCAVSGGITGNRNRSDNCFIGGINLGIVSNLDSTLRDNGGPTKTHRLFAGSNAIDQGFNGCRNPDTNAPLAFDQRKIARPQDGDGNGSAQCDIGAYEYVLTVKPPTASSQSMP